MRNVALIALSAGSCGVIVVKFARTGEKFVEISGWGIDVNSSLIDVSCGVIVVSFGETSGGREEIIN